jgi:hypothetical protein
MLQPEFYGVRWSKASTIRQAAACLNEMFRTSKRNAEIELGAMNQIA